MNERELDLALDRLAVEHVRRTAPPALRERVRSVPLTARRRAWLQRRDARGMQPLFSATRLVVAGAIVALFGGFLLAGMLTQSSEDRAPAAAPAWSSAGTEYEVTRVDRPDEAYPSAVTDEALWLLDRDGQVIVRVDARTSELTKIWVDSEPRTLVASEDAIWVVGESDVHRIDRTDLTVGEDPIRRSGDEPFAVPGLWHTSIVADGSLWIPAPEANVLVEIDLATQAVRAELRSPIAWSSSGTEWIATIGDAIWVHSDGRMTRLDLPTRTFTDPVDVPAVHGSNVIVSDDAIWLTGGETGQLWRVDPDTLEVTEALALDVGLSGGVAVGDALWLGTWHESTDDTGWHTDSAVNRFDTRTLEVTDVIPSIGGPWVMFDGALWAGYGGDRENELSRIDVDSGRVVGTLKVPSAHKQDELFPSENVMWVRTSTPPAGYLWRIERKAVVQDEAASPVEFTATWSWGPPIRNQTSTAVPTGIQHRGGAWRPGVLTMASDPRWQGTLSVVSNSDDYGAVGGPEVGIFAFRIENEEGAWQQMPTVSLIAPGATDELDRAVFVGERAYDGLISVVDITGDSVARTWDLHGYVIDGDLPPSPEPYGIE